VPDMTESQEWMARDLAALGDSDLGTLVLKKEVGEVVAFASQVVVLPINIIVRALTGSELSAETIALGMRETVSRLLPHGNSRLLAECLLTLSRSLRTFQPPMAAMDSIVMAVQVLRELDDRNALGRALLDLGVNLKDQALLYEAVRALELAEAVFEEGNDQGGRAAALFHRSTICRRLGAHHEALQLLDRAARILPDTPTAQGWVKQLGLDRIQNLVALDRRDEARREIGTWLADTDPDYEEMAHPLALLAEIEERDGHGKAATDCHCRAVAAAARAVFRHRTVRFRDKARENLDFVFARSLRQAASVGEAGLALGLLELSRLGSVHLPGVAKRVEGGELDREARASLREKKDQIVAEAAAAIDQAGQSLSRVQARAEWLIGEHDFMTHESYEPPTDRQGVERMTRRIQEKLPPGTLLLEYAWIDGSLHLIVAGGEGNVALHDTRQEQATVSMLTASFEEECLELLPTDALRALSRALLHPARAEIARASSLIVVPAVGLHGVPFHALPFDGRPLTESHLVRLAPSGLSLSAQATGSRLSASSDCAIVEVPRVPYANLEELPSVADEGALVAARFSGARRWRGADANAAGVLRPGRRDILHFACHGYYEDEAPLLSRLYLNDRPIFSFEIMLSALEARLIVLSACETALGSGTLGGRQQTMAMAFLKAGAQFVVASLWPLDDEVGSLLTDRFYAELLGGAGRSPAEALRMARLHVRSQPGFDHPYFWAPFAVYSTFFDEVLR